MSKIIWQCDQVWAGQHYNRLLFNTRKEAEGFEGTMQQMAPDQTFAIEAIRAEQVWN